MQKNVTIGITFAVDGKSLQGAATLSEDALKKLGDAARKAGDDGDKFTASMDKQASEAKVLNDSSKSLAETYYYVKGAVIGLAAAMGLFKAYEYAEEATMLASRYETLGVSMNIIGRNAGYTSAEMAKYAKSLEATGITMIEARSNITKMTSAQLDLNNSSKLARIAQDAAVIGNINSSEAFARMIHGIQSGQTEILRNIGITVNFEAAYQKMAMSLNRTVSSLSETEKAQARANAVMDFGTRIAGTYEAAMTTAGKQLNSMARYVENLKVMIGNVFLEEFTQKIETQTKYLKMANEQLKAWTDSGAVVEAGSRLATAIHGVTDAFIGTIAFLWEHRTAILAIAGVYASLKIGSVISSLVGSIAAWVASATAAAAASVRQGAAYAGVVMEVAKGNITFMEAAVVKAVAAAQEVKLAQAEVVAAEAIRKKILALVEEAVASGGSAAATGLLIGAETRLAAAKLRSAEATAAAAATQKLATAATVGGTGAVAAAGGALAFLGGPLGVVITLLGLAATAWTLFGNSAEDAMNKMPSDSDIEKMKANALKPPKNYADTASGTIERLSDRRAEALASMNDYEMEAGNSNSEYLASQLKEEIALIDKKIAQLKEVIPLQEQGKKTAEAKAAAEKEAAAGGATQVAYRQAQDAFDTMMKKYPQQLTYAQKLQDIERITLELKIKAAAASSPTDESDYPNRLREIEAQRLQAIAALNGTKDQGAARERLNISNNHTLAMTALETEKARVEMLRNTNQMGDDEYYQKKRGFIIATSNLEIEQLEKQARVNQSASDITGPEKALKAVEDKNKIEEAYAKRRKDLMTAEFDQTRAIHEANEKARDALTKGMADEVKAYEDRDAAQQDAITTTNESIAQMEFEVSLLGRAPELIARATALRQVDLEVQRRIKALRANEPEGGLQGAAKKAQEDTVAAIIKQGERQKEVIKITQNQTNAYNEQLRKVQELKKEADDFAQAAEGAFGAVGKALGDIAKSAAGYIDVQKQIAENMRRELDLAEARSASESEIAGIRDKYASQGAKSTLKMYGDMANAAKGFFKEGSSGYKAMEAASKVFRAFEMALSLQSYVTQLMQIMGIKTAQEGANDSMLSSLVNYVMTAIGLRQAEGQANATAAVANQGNGDPYSAFVRIAMMAAIMAALGFAVSGASGGGQVDIAKKRQEEQGTGTVLGDKTAKSTSIADSLELLLEYYSQGLQYSSSMLKTLISIDAGITGITKSVAASAYLTGNNTDGMNLGGKNVLGWGSTRSLADTGIVLSPQTLAAIREGGVKGNAYADITTTKSSWFGLSTKTSTSRELKPLTDSLIQQITDVVISMADGIKQAALILKPATVSAEDFGNQIDDILNAFNIDTAISFKDMKPGEIQEALQAVLSGVGDNMASAVITALLPGVAGFQRAGEGMMETLFRVAGGVEYAKQSLSELGIKMIDYTDIINKQGDVAVELIRQSIGVNEVKQFGGATGLMGILDAFTGSAEDLVTLYRTLLDVRQSMVVLGMDASKLSLAMIKGAGSIENLQDGLETMIESFTGDAQRLSGSQAALAQGFAALGMGIPSSREAFMYLVNSIDLTTEAGQTLYGQLIALAPAFDDVLNSIEAMRQSIGSLDEARARFMGSGGDAWLAGRRLSSATDAFMTSASWTRGLTQEQVQSALRNISDEDFARYTPQQQKWILDILNGVADVEDAVTTSAQSQIDAIIANGQTQLNAYQQTINAAEGMGRTPMERLTLRSGAQQDAMAGIRGQMAEWERLHPSGSTDPARMYYEYQQLELQLAALGVEAQLTSTQLGRLTELEAEYGVEKGDQIFELEKWRADMTLRLAGNATALAALEEVFNDRLDDIINGVASAAETLGKISGAVSAMGGSMKQQLTLQASLQAASGLGTEATKTRGYLSMLAEMTEKYGATKAEELVRLRQQYDEQMELFTGNAEAQAAITSLFNERFDEIAYAAEEAAGRLDSLRDSIKKYHEGLLLSDQSILTPEQRYQEALSQYNQVAAALAANPNDEAALAQYQQVADALLREARAMFGSSDMYSEIFARIFGDSGLYGGAEAPVMIEDIFPVDWGRDMITVSEGQKQAAQETTGEVAALRATVEELSLQLIAQARAQATATETLSNTIVSALLATA